MTEALNRPWSAPGRTAAGWPVYTETRKGARRQVAVAASAEDARLIVRAVNALASATEELNPWALIPKQYAGAWGFDFDEKNRVFFVCCGGHRILDAEDSEVCAAVCDVHNATLGAKP